VNYLINGYFTAYKSDYVSSESLRNDIELIYFCDLIKELQVPITRWLLMSYKLKLNRYAPAIPKYAYTTPIQSFRSWVV